MLSATEDQTQLNPIPEKENLRREIGVRALTLAILNIIVGTGIFVLPALIAETLGAASIIAYIICGVLISLIALCFAEAGSKVTVTGGAYAYIEAAFGPFAGFLSNNVFWFGACVFSDAAVANGLADTLKLILPSFAGDEILRIVFFAVLFGIMAFINTRSVKNGVRFIELAAFGKLIPLVLFVIVGVGSVSTKNLAFTSMPALNDLSKASLLLFFAFIGMETPVTNGGEIKNPRRTIPLAIFYGILLVLILYIAIQLVTQGILGDTILQHKTAPLTAAAAIIFGTAGSTIILVATIISMLGYIGGEVLSIPRILYAGARNRQMPKFLVIVHPKFQTPVYAIIVYAFLDFVIAASGQFQQLVIIASASMLLIYLGVVLATIKLRRIKSVNDEQTFRIPGGLIVPLLAMAVIVWLLISLSGKEFLYEGIFVAIFCMIYVMMKFTKKTRPG
jgi:amino acid transporter